MAAKARAAAPRVRAKGQVASEALGEALSTAHSQYKSEQKAPFDLGVFYSAAKPGQAADLEGLAQNEMLLAKLLRAAPQGVLNETQLRSQLSQTLAQEGQTPAENLKKAAALSEQIRTMLAHVRLLAKEPNRFEARSKNVDQAVVAAARRVCNLYIRPSSEAAVPAVPASWGGPLANESGSEFGDLLAADGLDFREPSPTEAPVLGAPALELPTPSRPLLACGSWPAELPAFPSPALGAADAAAAAQPLQLPPAAAAPRPRPWTPAGLGLLLDRFSAPRPAGYRDQGLAAEETAARLKAGAAKKSKTTKAKDKAKAKAKAKARANKAKKAKVKAKNSASASSSFRAPAAPVAPAAPAAAPAAAAPVLEVAQYKVMLYSKKSYAVREVQGKQVFQLAFERRPQLESLAKALAENAAAQLSSGLDLASVKGNTKAQWQTLCDQQL